MHIADTAKVADGLVPVEHGREFEDDAVSLFTQQRQQLYDVWRAVFYGIGACTVLVTTGRVQIDADGMADAVEDICG